MCVSFFKYLMAHYEKGFTWGCHLLCSQVPLDPIRSISHLLKRQLASAGNKGVSPQVENPSSSRQIPVISSEVSFSFTVNILYLCLFTGTDALCWEQELHRAWSAPSGGLLFVHKLFCCSPVPPHCRVRQSGSCIEETSFVSADLITDQCTFLWLGWCLVVK